MRRKISPTGTRRTRITPSRRSRSCRSMPAAVLLQRAPFLERHVRFDPPQRVFEPRPGHDHVADQPHQIVEPGQVHAHEVRRIRVSVDDP